MRQPKYPISDVGSSGGVASLEGVGYRHPHAVAALGMALAGFAILAALVLLGSAASWDDSVMRALDRHVAGMPTPVSAEGILELGLASGAFVTAGIGAALAATGHIRHAVFWVASIGGVLVLDPVLKALFQRPGMGDSDGYSFPSGTAMLSMAACAALLALARPGPARMVVALLGAGGTLAAGLSIVYLDWHYPSDVLAGWCIAVAWVSALWLSVFAARANAIGRGLWRPNEQDAPRPRECAPQITLTSASSRSASSAVLTQLLTEPPSRARDPLDLSSCGRPRHTSLRAGRS